MNKENNNSIILCSNCNGTGKIKCNCSEDDKCFSCFGKGTFKCPICDGIGNL
ncbi:hypothetical protein [Clostridium septicum]|uniref:Molecular chaperone DnaJ n=1 Tax=Clostridium septicum TaxID=1504 RepID=A0ABY5AYV3_CLOSE|nr:hypothetical protein [Clostridium septicum]MDU1313441.1 hypothetical protein [Clostridium septicum]UEC19436.1 hypothetical protein LK444_08340 [Clostridium septicum]USR99611.1 hypothetical protein NH397_08845 [Clostridium septicum]WLF68123.1 hypothetical protein Q6375_09015 [Clostridium septicum]